MSDIFLSYASADDKKADALTSSFEWGGWAVWPDLNPAAARSFRGRDEELEGARAVVVLWSRRAAESLWVSNALERARRRERLVVVLLEKVELPRGLAGSAVVDFSDWDGRRGSPTWNLRVMELLRLVGALVGRPWRGAAPPALPFEPPRPEAAGEPPQQKQAPPPPRQAAPPPKDESRSEGVFISYRRGEAAAYARGLYDRLAARFGRGKIFLDLVNVGLGEDFVDTITAAAEGCAVMVVIVSREWARGAGGSVRAEDYVRLEVATALRRKIRVIPILIQGAAMPAARELPEDLAPLARRNALAFSDTRWERDVEDLIKTLEDILKD